MLGGVGDDSYYPGFLLGPGDYDEERRLLGAFGVHAPEFPVDIFLYIASTLVLPLYNLVNVPNVQKSIDTLGLDPKALQDYQGKFWVAYWVVTALIAAPSIVVAIVAWIRRKKLGRV